MKRLRGIIISALAVFGLALTSGAQITTYNLSADFSTNQNPTGVWSYGYLTNLSSGFALFANRAVEFDSGGVSFHRWWRTPGTQPILQYITGGTGISDGGQGVFPPGTVIFQGGDAGGGADYCVARFTAPSNGTYSITVGATNYLNGPSSGDTDFHIRSNGVVIVSRNFPAAIATNVVLNISLSAGSTIDIAVGRGADNIQFGSGLKVGAIITSGSGPAVQSILSQQLPTAINPTNGWTLGWKSATNGAFTPYTARFTGAANGGSWEYWGRVVNSEGYVRRNVGTGVITDPNQGTFPVGSINAVAGPNGAPDNYAVSRYTIPFTGNYRVSVWGTASGSGDIDVHVAKNSVEAYGQFVAAGGIAAFTNTASYVAGDVIDIAVGRGADNNNSASVYLFDAIVEAIGAVVPPPDIVFTPASGLFTNQVVVGIVNNVGAGSQIRYTVNDVDPTSGSLLYTNTLTITSNATIRARLFAAGSPVSAVFTNTYTRAEDVQFNPLPGAFTNLTTVSLVNLVGSGQIRYTINGSDPTASSTLYSTPLTLTGNTTFRAGLFLNGFPISTVSTGVFTQVLADGVRFGPTPGLFTNQLTIRLTNIVGQGEVRFTINGGNPTAASTLYTGAFTTTSNTTIRAGVFLNGAAVSLVSTGDYGRVYALADGIPNTWRQQYFGAGYLTDPRVGAATDADGDGSSNLQEYLAGTDPLNPLSGFTVGIQAIPRITFVSIPGTTYKILRRDNANALTGVEVGQVTAVGTQTTYIDTSVTNPTGFYTVQPVP